MERPEVSSIVTGERFTWNPVKESLTDGDVLTPVGETMARVYDYFAIWDVSQEDAIEVLESIADFADACALHVSEHPSTEGVARRVLRGLATDFAYLIRSGYRADRNGIPRRERRAGDVREMMEDVKRVFRHAKADPEWLKAGEKVLDCLCEFSLKADISLWCVCAYLSRSAMRMNGMIALSAYGDASA